MATYKVLQDIEAEDKLVGPLTLRQFIYAGITAVCGYICFILLTRGGYFAVPIFFLPGLLTGFFAFPWRRDQPTEIWALAQIRFLLKPRRRIWDQSGVKEPVSITVPKRVEINYTNGLSQTEVKSRLHALADTIDTRGWAVRNVASGLYVPPVQSGSGQSSDRLFQPETTPEQTTTIDARGATDILDAQTSPIAMNFDRMMHQSDQEHREHILQSMSQPQITDADSPQLPQPQPTTNDYWFMSQQPAMHTSTKIVSPGSSDASQTSPVHIAGEDELSEKLRKQQVTQEVSYAHLHKILPLSEQKALAEKAAQAAAAAKAKQAPVTHQPDPAIMALARNNDLNVATIARQAKKDNPPDEVVISLH